jgi:hypothetical protein
MELTLPLSNWLLFRPVFEHREKNFRDSSDRPNSRELTGSDDILSLTATLAYDTSLFSVNLTGIRQNTRQDFDSNLEWGATLAYQISYASPFDRAAAPWQTVATAGRQYTDYDAPNPLVDPDTARFDRRWRFTLAQVFGLTRWADLVLQAQRDIVSSSLPNFAYTNTSVLVGSQIRF